MKPRVLNITHSLGIMPPGAVYIGRSTKWGNPFIIGKDGTRAQVLKKYRDWLATQPELQRAAQRELAGYNLVCHCSPQACHGDILLKLANTLPARSIALW